MAPMIILIVLGIAIALATQRGKTQDPEKKMSIGQVIMLGVAIAVGALGLVVVGGGILFALAMSSYGSNK